MYSLAVTRDFIANHFLIGGDWGSENFPHAHHYVVEVTIENTVLDRHGYLVDIVDVEAVFDGIVKYFRDSVLNDKPEFAGLNPSIEHFSRILHEKFVTSLQQLPAGGVLAIKLWENATCWAAYRKAY